MKALGSTPGLAMPSSLTHINTYVGLTRLVRTHQDKISFQKITAMHHVSDRSLGPVSY